MAILGQMTVDQISVLTVDTDPTVSGVSAKIGSIALLDNNTLGAMWVKSAAGDTGWTPIPRLPTGTTSLQANTIVYTDSNGFVKTDTTKFTWDQTNGRLGIGLSAPATPQSTIHIDRGTGVGGHIRFTAGTTTGQTAGDGLEIGIDNAGNAEIIQYENSALNFFTNNIRYGQFSASGKFILGENATPIDITGISTVPAFQIIGTTGANTQMAAIHYSADSIPPVFNLVKSRGATIGTQGLLSADDELGRLQFRGSDGVNFQAGASVRAAVDGTAAAGSMPGRLIFMTTPSGSTGPVERMRISQNGDVRIVDLLQKRRTVMDFDTFASANTTTTLTTASASIQIITGSTAGQIIRMPDATTLTVGAEYEIRNSSTKTLAVQDNAGGVLDTTPAVTGTTYLILTGNGTAAGTWYARTRFEPYANEVSATAGMSIASTTNVLITGMTITPPAGTYRVHFDAAVTATNANSTLGFAIYAGGTINTNSNKSFTYSNAGTPGSPYFGTTGTVTVDGTQAIEIRGRRSAGTTTVQVRTMHILRVG
jgi:hypothetical protein